MKKNKQKRGKITKKHILETALLLFSQKGYDNVTVQEIVIASDTSKGSFYAHFQSKYEIFLEKFKEIDDFYMEFSRTISPESSAVEKILMFVNGQMEFIQNELGKDIMRVIYSNTLINSNSYNYFLDQNRTLFRILRIYVEEGQKKKEINVDLSMEDILVVLSRCMRGSIYDWCMSLDDLNLAKESEKLFKIVLEGLSAEREKVSKS